MVRAPAMTRFLLLIALLAAVGLRALTPQGWMPDLGGRSGAFLVVCTGEGARTIADPAGPDPAHHAPGHHESGRESCAFAGLHFAPAPELAVLDAPGAAPWAEPHVVPAGLAPWRPDWRRPQAARAPPMMV